MVKRISLEEAALQFCIDNEKPPFIYELPPEEGRETLEEVQQSPVEKAECNISNEDWDLGENGIINVRIFKPIDGKGKPNLILYIHGAGWVFGSSDTHDKLAREIASRTNSIVFLPDYDRSPEAKYPVAIEQCYAALLKIAADYQNGEDLYVAGDSVGGNMATVMTMLAKDRKGPKIAKQLLYYPVTDHSFDTDSYHQFAIDYYLNRDGMVWFWNQYLPKGQDSKIKEISPLQASGEELEDLPPAMILTAEADVLRDEGEAYARNLRDAGVPVTQVRFQGMIHDFVMLNVLDQTHATRAAMTLSCAWLKK